jgi:PAS domain S-box-containing protein
MGDGQTLPNLSSDGVVPDAAHPLGPTRDANTGPRIGDSGRDEHFQALADAGPAMLWVTDAENRCTFLSRAWYEYTGQSEEEGPDFGWLDAVHPDDREETAWRFLDAAMRRVPFSLDHRLRRADGAFRWVIDEGRPRVSPEGEWLGYVGSVIDVHERRRATDALRESEARYRALFNSIDVGFCVIEVIFEGERPVDYRFLEANPAFERQTGLNDPLERTARELLPGLEEHWFRIYGRVALTGEPTRFVNGSEVMGRWFDVYAFRIDEPALCRVAILFTDISDHRRHEAEREELLQDARAAREAAEVANRTKADFLASMSHELRTPLNAIGGYVDLLDLGIHGPLAEAQRRALERITANQRHLLTLINDILSFARLEAGQIQIDAEPVDVHPLLAGLEALVGPQAAARGIRYTVEPAPDEVRLLGDAERVRQILLNLVGNAIKFTPPEGSVEVACRADPSSVYLRVSDDGPGIPQVEQSRIFDPFQQVGRRLNQPREGVGLGLAISRDLARAMDGDITVESEPGHGSTFTLRLPRSGEGPQ